MADIDIQKKSGSSAWLWVLALIVLALLVWFVAAAWDDEGEYGYGEQAGVEGVYDNQAGAAYAPTVIPVAAIADRPNEFANRPVNGALTVSRVVSDRAFFAEQNGRQLFVIIDPTGSEAPNINAGQRIAIDGKVVTGVESAADLQGIQNLEPQAQQIAQQQNAFIVANSARILSGSQNAS